MSDSNAIGREFEQKVERLLKILCAQHPTLVHLESQKRIDLQSNELKLPDFYLTVEYPHERRHYYIECQNRTRSSRDINQKIFYIRAKSQCQTFFFVYSERLSPGTSRALKAEGVTVMQLIDLELWTRRLGTALKEEPSLEPDKPKIDVFELTSLTYKSSLARRLLRRLKAVVSPLVYYALFVGCVTILTPLLKHSEAGRAIATLTSSTATITGATVDSLVHTGRFPNDLGIVSRIQSAFRPGRTSFSGFTVLSKYFSGLGIPYTIPGGSAVIAVVTPSDDDFNWLVTGLPAPPDDIKSDWLVFETSSIGYVDAIQRTIQDLQVAHLINESNLPQGEPWTFLSDAVKSIRQAKSIHILGVQETVDDPLIVFDLRDSLDQQLMYMMFKGSQCCIIKPPKQSNMDTK